MSIVESGRSSNRVPPAAWNGGLGAQLGRLFLETDGQDMVEYALLTTFIGFVGAAAWSVMQTSLGSAYAGYNKAVWDIWEPVDPVGGAS